jgi:hypothetical protein
MIRVYVGALPSPPRGSVHLILQIQVGERLDCPVCSIHTHTLYIYIYIYIYIPIRPWDIRPLLLPPFPSLSLTHSHARTRTHSRTHALTHARTHAHTHARTHAYTHTHTHTPGGQIDPVGQQPQARDPLPAPGGAQALVLHVYNNYIYIYTIMIIMYLYLTTPPTVRPWPPPGTR